LSSTSTRHRSTHARIAYRDGRNEIDSVLESRSGEFVAIEVKASATLHARDWRALEKLRHRIDGRFRAGVLIHAGRQTLPLGDRLWALPISGLWG
jgi:predicted AAA+ superfamily ATPase